MFSESHVNTVASVLLLAGMVPLRLTCVSTGSCSASFSLLYNIFSIVSAVTNNIALNISVHVSWCVDTRVFLGMCLETEISGGHFSGCQWEQARVEESCWSRLAEGWGFEQGYQVMKGNRCMPGFVWTDNHWHCCWTSWGEEEGTSGTTRRVLNGGAVYWDGDCFQQIRHFILL